MDISLLSTTSGPEQLRTLAIAMVQKVMAENAELQNRILMEIMSGVIILSWVQGSTDHYAVSIFNLT